MIAAGKNNINPGIPIRSIKASAHIISTHENVENEYIVRAKKIIESTAKNL